MHKFLHKWKKKKKEERKKKERKEKKKKRRKKFRDGMRITGTYILLFN